MSDRFRACVIRNADPSTPYRETLADADAGMLAETFRRIRATYWYDEDNGCTVAGIYERRPPTEREAGDKLAELAKRHMDEVGTLTQVAYGRLEPKATVWQAAIRDWEKAVARQESPKERERDA